MDQIDDLSELPLTYPMQMMFVSGETAEPSAETTWMIEEIVREQVVEMVSQILFFPPVHH
jgi:Transcription initiation factor IID, 18kD subunit